MEQNTPKPMTPFDNMVTPPHLYTLKLLLPYTPSSNQRMLAVYIKFMELQYTLQNFHGFSAKHSKKHHSSLVPADLLEDLKPYMAREDMAMMEQMESAMNMMEMMQGMQASGNGNAGLGSFNPMDMMMGMFGSEQQDMFQKYSDMFDSDLSQMSDPSPAPSQENDNNQKGESTYEHESMDKSSSYEGHRPSETRAD